MFQVKRAMGSTSCGREMDRVLWLHCAYAWGPAGCNRRKHANTLPHNTAQCLPSGKMPQLCAGPQLTLNCPEVHEVRLLAALQAQRNQERGHVMAGGISRNAARCTTQGRKQPSKLKCLITAGRQELIAHYGLMGRARLQAVVRQRCKQHQVLNQSEAEGGSTVSKHAPVLLAYTGGRAMQQEGRLQQRAELQPTLAYSRVNPAAARIAHHCSHAQAQLGLHQGCHVVGRHNQIAAMWKGSQLLSSTLRSTSAAHALPQCRCGTPPRHSLVRVGRCLERGFEAIARPSSAAPE